VMLSFVEIADEGVGSLIMWTCHIKGRRGLTCERFPSCLGPLSQERWAMYLQCGS
jgi:hypothetical protein